jgi:hypothetical protein
MVQNPTFLHSKRPIGNLEPAARLVRSEDRAQLPG